MNNSTELVPAWAGRAKKRVIGGTQRAAVGAAILWELFLPPHKPASQADLAGRVMFDLVSVTRVEASPESIWRVFSSEEIASAVAQR